MPATDTQVNVQTGNCTRTCFGENGVPMYTSLYGWPSERCLGADTASNPPLYHEMLFHLSRSSNSCSATVKLQYQTKVLIRSAAVCDTSAEHIIHPTVSHEITRVATSHITTPPPTSPWTTAQQFIPIYFT